MTGLPDHFEPLGERLYGGRKLVLAGGPLAAYSAAFLEKLREYGATDLFIAARGLGTGEVPPEDLAERLVIEFEARTVMEEIRGGERLLADPPAYLVEALDRWDPDGEALVIGDGFTSLAEVAGRRVLGARPQGMVALEDKVVIDAVWDSASVPRAPSTVVRRDPGAIEASFTEYDLGAGIVLAADASRGWHGGAEGVRWAHTPSQVAEIVDGWVGVADRVRVMPFLEGIPCSVHGIVFPTAVAVFRPCEMLVYSQPNSAEFVYCGSATLWDPDPLDREAMRSHARRAGEVLRDEHAYRGGYTIDGVMTRDGFLPTELNARLGAAFGQVGGALEGMSWGTIQRALLEGEPFDYRVPELEAAVVEAADAKRSVRAVSFGSGRRMRETEGGMLVSVDGGYRIAAESEHRVGTVSVGPNAQGYFARISIEEGHLAVGPPAGPAAAAALGAVDDHWSLGIGHLVAAKPVR